jgi:hypothetical protein
VHVDSCEGRCSRACLLRLPRLARGHRAGSRGHAPPRGRHDLCLRFAQRAIDPLWVIDSIQCSGRRREREPPFTCWHPSTAGACRSPRCPIRSSPRAWRATGSPSIPLGRAAGALRRRDRADEGRRHAVTLRTAIGIDVLVHVGIDTVSLGGEGFSTLSRPVTGCVPARSCCASTSIGSPAACPACEPDRARLGRHVLRRVIGRTSRRATR